MSHSCPWARSGPAGWFHRCCGDVGLSTAPERVVGTAGTGTRSPRGRPHVGAGQIPMAVRIWLTPSPASTRHPAAGKGPRHHKQGSRMLLLPHPSPGHSSAVPTQHGAAESVLVSGWHTAFGVRASQHNAGCAPTSQRCFYWGTASLFKAFCSSLHPISLTWARTAGAALAALIAVWHRGPRRGGPATVRFLPSPCRY